MKRLVFILWLTSTSALLAAQSVDSIKQDSVRKELTKLPADTAQLNALFIFIWSEIWNYPEIGYQDAVAGLIAARKIGYLRGEASFLNGIALSFFLRSDYNNALNYAYKALRIGEQIGDEVNLWNSNIAITSILREEKDYPEALKYAKRALELGEKMSDTGKMSVAMANIGSVFSQMNQLDSAKFYLQILYDNKAYNYKNAYTSLELGHVYFKLHQYDLALKYYQESEINPQKKDLVDTYVGLANVFKALKQTDSCLIYAKKAIDLGRRYKYYFGVIDAGNLLAELYQPFNLSEAYKYHLSASAAKDSLYSIEKVRQSQSLKFGEQIRLQEIEQAKIAEQNSIKQYALLAGLGVMCLIGFILYRNNRQKQKANMVLHRQKEEIDLQRNKAEKALTELKSAQMQLIQSEKMASLGQLTAGIAHEIQNPLNFVNNFAEVSAELAQELKEEIAKAGLSADKKENIDDLVADLIQNQQKINFHGKRADSIVKGMLQHSRSAAGVKAPTDLNRLADEYLRLSYQGLRGKDKTFNAALKTRWDESLPAVDVVAQDVGRVLVNIFTNAFYSVMKKKKETAGDFQPTVGVVTEKKDNFAEIRIRDNGLGIPQNVVDKIFNPFFTTKPTGEGTGLGLSLSYEIIAKEHGGSLQVETKEGEFAEFIIRLPL